METAAKFGQDLTHSELVEITTSSLYTILKTDNLLRDIPSDITLEEVNSKIAVEYGQSITIILLRDQEAPLDIIVPQQNTTVGHLKKAIKWHFEMYQKRAKYSSNTKISWSYIWKTYGLEYSGTLLDNDSSPISSYGVANKSKINFVKKLKTKR